MTLSPLRVSAESIRQNWILGNKADKFANSRRWRNALPSMRAVGRRDGSTQMIAKAIHEANNAERPLEDEQEKPTDTVERLARAAKYFYLLVEIDCQRARRCRRRYGYTRFSMLYDLWRIYEFDINEHGFEYIELGMSNKGVEMFLVDAEDATPEWKRRAADAYSKIRKLVDDLDTPDELREAARGYVRVYDKFYPPVTKEYKRKPGTK